MGGVGFMFCASGPGCDSGVGGGGAADNGAGGAGGGGGAGRWGTSGGAFMASMRLRMAMPSKGAPMSSAEVLSLSGRMAAPGPLGRDWDWDWEWVGTWLEGTGGVVVCARCCDSGCGCDDCDCDGVAAAAVAANSLVAGSLGDVCDRDTKDDAVDR